MNRITQIILLLLALLLPATAMAYNFEMDGIYYNIINGNEVEVTFRSGDFNSYSGDVDIPATVTYGGMTYSVTSIGGYAFFGSIELTKIDIPNSVTAIGNFAFADCRGLANVTIPNSVSIIGISAFERCTGLTSINIPNSVTDIGWGAFSDCSGLTSVTIGCSVTAIGNYAFANCTSLTMMSVDNDNTVYDSRNNCNAIIETASSTLISGCKNTIIPNTVTAIGNYAFSRCSGLTEIDIPNSVTDISVGAFNECSGLTNVTIPNSITAIGDYAFYNCSELYRVNIPNSVVTIGDEAFAGCSALTDATIGCSVTAIGDYAFNGCSGLTGIDIPNSVLTIGNSAFAYCTDLANVNIGSSVTSIGNYAFSGCAGLANVNIGCSVTTIGNQAFEYCINISNIAIPNSVTTIGDHAFYNCSELVHVSIPNSVTTIGSGAFEGTKWFDTMSDGLIYAGLIALKYKGEMPAGTSVTIRSGTVSIAGAAFSGCSGLKRITIPNSVTNIGSNAFSGCSGLTSITIPNSVTNIGSNAFSGCSGLTSITIPNSVTNIGNYAFSGCSGLTNVSIPSSVMSIGTSAFANCIGLTVMSVANGNTVYDSRDNCNAIIETTSNTLISGCKNTVIPNTVTVIGNYAFYNCSELYRVNIPNSVTSIGNSAFNGCSGLTSIEIPNSVTSIGNGAFYCSGLTRIDIPNSVTTIGMFAFSGCSGLTCVTIPNSVTAIYAQVFQNCKALIDVYCYIPDLSKATIGMGIFNLSYGYGNNDYSGRTLHVPVGSVESYQNSDKWGPYFGNIVEVGLQVDDLTALHGDTIVIPVCLTNTKDIMAFQTDVFLPEGFSIVTDEDDEYVVTPSDRLTGDHGIMTNDANNGSVRVICYTIEPKPIFGDVGALFYMTVAVPDDAAGDYGIVLKNTRLTATDYSETTLPDVSANIHVNVFLRGDANDSRKVNVADIVTTARYVLYMNPAPFVFAAADMNGDGEISVTDMMQIARLILNPTINAPRHVPMAEVVYDSMSADNITPLLPGETCTVSLVLDNEMSYSGFQFDLNMPDGLEASNFRLMDRAGDHSLNVNTIGNGKIRALCYSPVVAAISGDSGALLNFDVTATAPVHDNIIVNGIELVTTDCKMVRLDDFTIDVRNSTAVIEITSSKTVAHVEYYNLAGQRLTQPGNGATIIVTTYSDGTRSTTKIHQ